MGNQIQIFQGIDNKIKVEVRFEEETVWVTQGQLIELFDSSKANISEHIKSIFQSNELDESATVRKFRTVQMEGKRNIERTRLHYNLDVIISVGYRVNSKRGTQFRQWATQQLKEFLVQGYIVNHQRLAQKNQELILLHDGIRILSRAIEEVSDKESFSWLNAFSTGLQLLDDYDHEQLDTKGLSLSTASYPKIEEYMMVVKQMRKEFESDIFAKIKDEGFISAVNQIAQGFGEEDIYPSIEEKAAMLLYMIIKNHAFVDGNKRIAAACFLMFLERNKLLNRISGASVISNEALASITLFVAASKTEEMETVKRLIVSVLNRSKE
jgi:death-on-curing family protein